jgi:GTP-binding protein
LAAALVSAASTGDTELIKATASRPDIRQDNSGKAGFMGALVDAKPGDFTMLALEPFMADQSTASTTAESEALPDPAAALKRALAWTHTARFLTTASQLDQLPATELPEIAFVGRSNAGKSTAINMLTQQKRLAFASKTPGRTQHINLFELGPRTGANALFADLPGYGYAAVARGAKARWQRVMADYLELRRSLAGVVLMVDSRLGFTDLDRQLLEFISPRIGNGSVKLLVLLTKADKLNRREADAAAAAAQQLLGELTTEQADVGIALFSALSKRGVGDAAQVLHGWAGL